MKTHALLYMALVLTVCLIPVQIAARTAGDPADSTRKLLSDYSGEDVPGAAVMVMKDDDILFRENYGMASLTYGIPVSNDTRHNIGSTSKQFTCFAVALLADEGKLSLDDDVRDHLPELPDFGHTVTLRNLMTHTSGYREFLNTLAMTGYYPGSPFKREKIIEIVQRQPELQNIPGEEFNYNNTGYSLLTIVVERVSGDSFPEFLKNHVFEPAGMAHTVVRERPAVIIPEGSQGYTPSDDGTFHETPDLYGAMGAGGIYTTMEDLAAWIRFLHDPGEEYERVVADLKTPFMLNNGESTQYGLGLFLGEYRGRTMIYHPGGDMAHRSMMVYFPDFNGAVVTQSNHAAFPGSMAFQIADLFFHDEFEPGDEPAPLAEGAVPDDHAAQDRADTSRYAPEDFDALTGRYELDAVPGFILSFYRDEDRIYTQASNQPELDLEALSDSTFRLIGVPATITFHRNRDGSADSLTLHQNGRHLARRIVWQPDPDMLPRYAGNYFSDEIETFCTIALEDDKLHLNSYWMDKRPLSAASEDTFSAGSPLGNLNFIRNESGSITGFEANIGRTKGIYFEKME